MTPRIFAWAAIAAAACALALTASALDAGAVTPLAPNLKALRAADLRVETDASGNRSLRLSATTWNDGDGPLELRAGEVDLSQSTQRVYQRVYNDNGTYTETLAGTFVWHQGHGHFHFDDYALYTLQPADAPGASSRTSAKTTFCIIDTTRISHARSTPRQPVYRSCGSAFQGLSRGWGDTYPSSLIGQSIDITGLPDGDYRLTIEVDPQRRLAETDEDDNTSSVLLRLSNGTVRILDGNGKKK